MFWCDSPLQWEGLTDSVVRNCDLEFKAFRFDGITKLTNVLHKLQETLPSAIAATCCYAAMQFQDSNIFQRSVLEIKTPFRTCSLDLGSWMFLACRASLCFAILQTVVKDFVHQLHLGRGHAFTLSAGFPHVSRRQNLSKTHLCNAESSTDLPWLSKTPPRPPLGLRWDSVGTLLGLCWDSVGTLLGLRWATSGQHRTPVIHRPTS